MTQTRWRTLGTVDSQAWDHLAEEGEHVGWDQIVCHRARRLAEWARMGSGLGLLGQQRRFWHRVLLEGSGSCRESQA